jgi:hypothetical protein
MSRKKLWISNWKMFGRFIKMEIKSFMHCPKSITHLKKAPLTLYMARRVQVNPP